MISSHSPTLHYAARKLTQAHSKLVMEIWDIESERERERERYGRNGEEERHAADFQ